MPKSRRKPAYTLHAATGQARVRIEGKDHYLGVYGSAESRDRYDDLISAWLAKQDVKGLRLTIDDLALLYLLKRSVFGFATGLAGNRRTS